MSVNKVRRPWEIKPINYNSMPGQGRKNDNGEFYRSRAWRSLRAMKLYHNPLCECCMENGQLTQAKVVDHVIPINLGGEPMDISNLKSLCIRCHNRKSAKERRG